MSPFGSPQAFHVRAWSTHMQINGLHSPSRYVGIVSYGLLSDEVQTSLPSSLAQQALHRDARCVFSGQIPSIESDVLVATWIFPPSLGHEVCTHFPVP